MQRWTRVRGVEETAHEHNVCAASAAHTENATGKWDVEMLKMAHGRMSGSRAGLRGGNLNNGANDGAWYVNVNNGLSNTNANYGCRLSEYMKAKVNSASMRHHLLVDGFARIVLVGWPERTGRIYAHEVAA